MARRSIDATFAAIIQDYQAVAVEAVKNAAKKVQDDILKEAKAYLQYYYFSFNPKQYKRTYRLKRAILPYWADKTGKNGVSIEVGVQYKSSALKGIYTSNSRFHQTGDVWKVVTDHSHVTGDNGIPEPEWILGNFLSGQHGGYQQDPDSTNTLMLEFFEHELPDRIDKYVKDSMWDVITSRLGGG